MSLESVSASDSQPARSIRLISLFLPIALTICRLKMKCPREDIWLEAVVATFPFRDASRRRRRTSLASETVAVTKFSTKKLSLSSARRNSNFRRPACGLTKDKSWKAALYTSTPETFTFYEADAARTCSTARANMPRLSPACVRTWPSIVKEDRCIHRARSDLAEVSSCVAVGSKTRSKVNSYLLMMLPPLRSDEVPPLLFSFNPTTRSNSMSCRSWKVYDHFVEHIVVKVNILYFI